MEGEERGKEGRREGGNVEGGRRDRGKKGVSRREGFDSGGGWRPGPEGGRLRALTSEVLTSVGPNDRGRSGRLFVARS